ncbi:MAG: DUF1707 SHOCT-like domain-containing protein [Acidobacteriota bacterium]
MNDALLTDRRDQVVDRLSSEYAIGTFELDELERRLALVHAARTPAELDALVTDLVPARATALVPAQRLRIVMGSTERRGPWTVPPQLAARVVMGNLVLDLREARLAASETTIEVSITMGHVEVIVPPGVDVEVEASSLLASVEDRTDRSSAPGHRRSLVRIVGRIKLGNLELSTMRPGETPRDARRRRRAERRAHRRWHRAARFLEW